MESRPIWLQRAYLSAGSPGVRKGQTWPWSARVGADSRYMALVGPWQYQCTGIRTGGYYPLPGYPPYRTTPGTTPPHRTHLP